MKRIIVTGATGQVGSAVITALLAFDAIAVLAAVRDVAKWRGDARVQSVGFNFSVPASQDAALADCDSCSCCAHRNPLAISVI